MFDIQPAPYIYLGKQMYFSQANVPIKESTFVEPPTNSTVRLPSVQCKQDCTGLSENLMSLSVDDKALEDTVNSSEEEEEEGSSSKSEEEPQTEEDFLRAAGIVDFDLGDLTCNEEGLAPLELITNVCTERHCHSKSPPTILYCSLVRV